MFTRRSERGSRSVGTRFLARWDAMASRCLLAALIAALLAVGCRLGSDRHRPGAVLLVTLSTARADRFDGSGGAPGATSSFTALANAGTMFTRAYAHSPATLPSLASVLTGRVPRSHGVVSEGSHALGGMQTIATRLGARGWRTVAVTGGPFARVRWGLDRGFAAFEDTPPMPQGGERVPPFRRADEVVDRAIAVIEAHPTDAEPLFLWVHLHDAHWPVDVPERWRAAYPASGYDAEIAFVDAAVGRLVDAWDDRFEGRPNLVAVTGDHGEALGDGGEQTHGALLHDATLRVPLVLRGAGVQAGLRTSDPVGHIDLAYTLVSLAGGSKRGMQGRDLRMGGSSAIWHESPAAALGLGLPSGSRATCDDGHCPPLETMLGKYEAAVAPEVVLDDRTLEVLAAIGYVGADPSASGSARDGAAVARALPFVAEARQRMAAAMSSDARAAIDALERELGDEPGVGLLRAAWLKREGRLPEAAEAYESVWARSPAPTWSLQIAGLRAAMGDWSGAAAWAHQVLEAAPDTPEALILALRADRRLGTGRADDLAAALAARFPDHPQQSLARAELLLPEQPGAALHEIAHALDEQPGNAWAHLLLGEALWASGDADAAIEVMQRALRIDPYQSAIRVPLVRCLLEVGRNAEAARVAAALARLLPDDPQVQELYRSASLAVTVDEKFELRRDRARGPAALP
jgi:arylsulfatase A-like enzyme/tetratricopeptide (TPR) repeat protein